MVVRFKVVAGQAWNCDLANRRSGAVALSRVVWLRADVGARWDRGAACGTGRLRGGSWLALGGRGWCASVNRGDSCLSWWRRSGRRPLRLAISKRALISRAEGTAVGGD